MKKAYELSTLTGIQVLLLVVSETGLVYTFTTAKLQPLVTQPEGKDLIQPCLNALHDQLPSQMHRLKYHSVIAPGPQPMVTPSQANVSGGLSIGSDGHKDEGGELKDADGANKRRRRGSGTAQSTNPPPQSATSTANNRAAPPPSSHSPNAPIPAPAPPSMNIPEQMSGAPRVRRP